MSAKLARVAAIVFALAGLSSNAFAGLSNEPPITDGPVGPAPGPLTPTGLGPASASWLLECPGAAQTSIGGLSLKQSVEIDPRRCFRKTTGDLVLQSNDNTLSALDYVVLPWLEVVSGDVRLIPGSGGATFDEIRLPRLRWVGGELHLNFNDMFEGISMPELEAVDRVEVVLRTNDMNLTGLDSLVDVDSLDFDNPNPTNAPIFRGINGLPEVGSIVATGYGALPSPTPALDALVLVYGDVSLQISAPQMIPTNYRPIYATGSVETICGNLTVNSEISDLDLLAGFPSLQQVAGNVTITGVARNRVSAFMAHITTGGSPVDCQ